MHSSRKSGTRNAEDYVAQRTRACSMSCEIRNKCH